MTGLEVWKWLWLLLYEGGEYRGCDMGLIEDKPNSAMHGLSEVLRLYFRESSTGPISLFCIVDEQTFIILCTWHTTVKMFQTPTACTIRTTCGARARDIVIRVRPGYRFFETYMYDSYP